MDIRFDLEYFKFNSPVSDLAQPEKWDVDSISCTFKLFANGVLFLEEPEWNIVELSIQLDAWAKQNAASNFKYDCMDSEEPDLFTISEVDSKFTITSCWASDNQRIRLDKNTLFRFIEQLKAQAILGADVGLGVAIHSFYDQ